MSGPVVVPFAPVASVAAPAAQATPPAGPSCSKLLSQRGSYGGMRHVVAQHMQGVAQRLGLSINVSQLSSSGAAKHSFIAFREAMMAQLAQSGCPPQALET